MKHLFVLASGMFAMGFEDYLFPGLLPEISNTISSSIVATAQGCSIFGFAYIFAIPFCAFLLYRYSVRNILITALLLFISGNTLTILSTNLIIYLASRFLTGLGGGLFLPLAVAVGSQLVRQDYKGRALGIMWTFNSAGAVVGVPLGLWIANKFGWHASIILILALSILTLIGILFQNQSMQVDSPPPSLRSQVKLLTNLKVLSVIGITFMTAIGCLGLYSYISEVLVGSKSSANIAFSLWSIGGLIGSFGVGYILDRYEKAPVVMSAILAILFLVILLIPTLSEISFWGHLPFLIWGMMGWASVPTQQYTLSKIIPNHDAILVALNSTAVSLGGVLGTIIGGLALTNGVISNKLPYGTIVFVLMAFVFQLLLIKKSTHSVP